VLFLQENTGGKSAGKKNVVFMRKEWFFLLGWGRLFRSKPILFFYRREDS